MRAVHPVLLQSDNFTPPSRTPWGGTRIAGLKGLPGARVVGESWECSVEPDFPSRLANGSCTLAEWSAADPEGALGREAAVGRRSTGLLVKLLDAADELSVQIHPSDGDPRLGAGECGKPECWYAAEVDDGAGVYLGLADGVTRADVEAALRLGADASALLSFVPLSPGDFLVIEAGTAHAIGRGLLLVEPQRVLPESRGVTWRFWDWNRRYAPDGRLDAAGSPRPLHVADALGVTRWDAPRGEALLARCRMRTGLPNVAGPATATALCGRSRGLRSNDLEVHRVAGTGTTRYPVADAFSAVTVLEGVVEVGGLRVPAGSTAAVPAVGPRDLRLGGAHAIVSAVY